MARIKVLLTSLLWEEKNQPNERKNPEINRFGCGTDRPAQTRCHFKPISQHGQPAAIVTPHQGCAARAGTDTAPTRGLAHLEHGSGTTERLPSPRRAPRGCSGPQRSPSRPRAGEAEARTAPAQSRLQVCLTNRERLGKKTSGRFGS